MKKKAHILRAYIFAFILTLLLVYFFQNEMLSKIFFFPFTFLSIIFLFLGIILTLILLFSSVQKKVKIKLTGAFFLFTLIHIIPASLSFNEATITSNVPVFFILTICYGVILLLLIQGLKEAYDAFY